MCPQRGTPDDVGPAGQAPDEERHIYVISRGGNAREGRHGCVGPNDYVRFKALGVGVTTKGCQRRRRALHVEERRRHPGTASTDSSTSGSKS